MIVFRPTKYFCGTYETNISTSRLRLGGGSKLRYTSTIVGNLDDSTSLEVSVKFAPVSPTIPSDTRASKTHSPRPHSSPASPRRHTESSFPRAAPPRPTASFPSIAPHTQTDTTPPVSLSLHPPSSIRAADSECAATFSPARQTNRATTSATAADSLHTFRAAVFLCSQSTVRRRLCPTPLRQSRLVSAASARRHTRSASLEANFLMLHFLPPAAPEIRTPSSSRSDTKPY